MDYGTSQQEQNIDTDHTFDDQYYDEWRCELLEGSSLIDVFNTINLDRHKKWEDKILSEHPEYDTMETRDIIHTYDEVRENLKILTDYARLYKYRTPSKEELDTIIIIIESI